MTSSSEYESKKASFNSESSLKDAMLGVEYSLVSKERNEKGIV